MFELMFSKNAFEDSAQGWSPRGKTIHDKVAEALPLRIAHQGRPSFTQTQHNNVYTRLRHKILAPETVHYLPLKPGLQQDRAKGFVWYPTTHLCCLLLPCKES